MSEEKANQKDAVFDASIEFIKTLTGMEPPPIEIAPLEILQPFREFTEKVCSIFYDTPPQRTWVGLTDEEVTTCHSLAVLSKKHDGTDPSFTTMLHRQIEAKLRSKNYD